jgi:hypothetical protein
LRLAGSKFFARRCRGARGEVEWIQQARGGEGREMLGRDLEDRGGGITKGLGVMCQTGNSPVPPRAAGRCCLR